MPPIFNWTYVPRSFLTTWCLPKEKNKKEWREKLWLLHESKYIKVKYRPFAEGSRGCHALICLYAQPLSAKEHHVMLPLMIATFIMQSVTFILHHHKFLQRSIFSYTKWSHTFRSNFYCLFAPMITYLKDLTQYIGRYGGLSKQDLGLRVFGCTSSISTWCGIFR